MWGLATRSSIHHLSFSAHQTVKLRQNNWHGKPHMTVSLRLVMTQEGSIKNGSLKNYFNQPAFILSSSHRNCLFLPHACPLQNYPTLSPTTPPPLLIIIWCVFHHFLNEIESARVPAEMYIKVKIMKPKYWTRTQFISHFQTFLFQHKCKIYFRTSVLHVLFEMFEVNWNTHTQTTLKKNYWPSV